MQRHPEIERNKPIEMDELANNVAMAVWNEIAELPSFHDLTPKDYPSIYEAVLRALKETIC